MIRRLLAATALLSCCALVPASAQAASPGVNLLNDISGPAVNVALNTGAREVRLFVDWSSVEPGGPGDFTVNPVTGQINDNNLARGTLAAINQIHRAGKRVNIVVTNAPGWANGGQSAAYPPSDPATYATFVGEFAQAARLQGSPIDEMEVWNEPDGGEFWLPGPEPARYTALLQASYAAIKGGSAQTAVYAGPTTGNDYNWIQELYAAGAKGSFDGVAVHTDTACSIASPSSFYRDNGRLGQFTFLGYREVRATMLANGDDKPIAISEIGWSSTNGGPKSCARGASAGKKPSGVSEATQAQYLTQAFACMANDPYVTTADWFQLHDTRGGASTELNHYGLLDTGGSRKASLTAFKTVAAANGGKAGPCGDFSAPAIRVVSPTPGEQFAGKLDLSAAATDKGVGLGRISFFVDGLPNEIRNFTDSLRNNSPVGLSPWQNSGKLALGPHTIKVVALDKNGNQSSQTINVTKVVPSAIKKIYTPKFKLASKVKCVKRSCTISGSLGKNGHAGAPSVGGKVSVAWEFRNKNGQYRKLSGGLKPANAPFKLTAKLKRAGHWRVRVTYAGNGVWKPTAAHKLTFTLK